MKRKILLTLLSLVIAVSAFCGIHAFASDVSVTGTGEEAPNESPELSFYGAALVLNNTIDIRYMVNAKNVADPYDLELLIWTDARDEYVKGTENYRLAYSGKTMTYKGVVYPSFDFDGVGAKRLADSYYAVVCLETEDGIIYSAPCKYSVLQYAYNKLGKTGTATTDENLKALIKEMLEYGAASQRYLDYKTERLADDDFYQVKVSGGLLPDGFNSGLYLEGDKVTLTASDINASGEAFLYWTNPEGELLSNEKVLEITVGAENKTYTAVYGECLSHFMGEWYVDTNETCTSPGLDKRECRVCGAVETQERPMLDHDYDGVVTAPTCVDKGYTTYTCGNCGDSYVDSYVSATGHAEVIDQAVEPTCTETGLTEGSHCSVCFAVLVEQSIIEEMGHNFIQHEGKSPTCLEIGWDAYETCSRCDYTNYSELEAFGHSYINDICTRCGEHEYLIFSSEAYNGSVYEVCGYKGSPTEVVIPSWYNGKTVLYIAKQAFKDCTSMTNVTIPTSVRYINELAFSGCTGLTNIEIPSSVIYFGQGAFQDCNSLQSITLPLETDRMLGHRFGYLFGNDAFGSAVPGSLKTVVITDATEVDNYMFQGCSGLTSIVLPEGLTEIGNGAFMGCSIRAIDIPNSVTYIGEGAFECCENLVSVTIPDGITEICRRTFYSCSALKSITIPASVTFIGEQVIMGVSLPTVYYGSTPKQWNAIAIEYWNDNLLSANIIFSDCPGHVYEGVTTPAGCTEDGKTVYTCKFCDSSYEEAIPATGHNLINHEAKAPTCTDKGWNAYETCSRCNYTTYAEKSATGHTEIIDAEVAPTCTETGLTEGKHCSRCGEILIAQTVIDAIGHSYNSVVTAPTCVDKGYTTYTCDNCGDTYVGNYVDAAHSYNDGVITTDPTCTEDGIKTFTCGVCGYIYTEEVDALGHTEVVDEAVEPTCSNTGLTRGTHCSVCNEVILEQTVIAAEKHSFVNGVCSVCGCDYFSEGLTYSSYGDGTCYVSGIGTCTDNDLVIPSISPTGEKVIGIGNSAFKDSKILYSVFLPDTITKIGNYAFSGCTNISKVHINSIESWCNIEFAYEKKRESGDYYYYCSSNPLYYSKKLYINGVATQNLVIPEGVTEIKPFAFHNSGYTSVTMPTTVSKVGLYAFSTCSSLSGVYISDLKAWCNISFDYETTYDEGVPYYYSGQSNPLVFAKNLYLNGQKITSLAIPSGVTSIKPYAFYNGSFTSLSISSTVTEVGINSFGNSKIKSVSFAEGLRYLSNKAFADCTQLTTLNFPNSLISIGEMCFQNCSALTSVRMGTNLNSIDYAAFGGCGKLSSVTFLNTSGWSGKYESYLSATFSSSALSNASTAATYLKSTYLIYTWSRR